jgi:CBS domain-containing protein
MTRDVRRVDSGMTIRDAARLMAETDTGALPVSENDRLIGMITDRDIAVRAVGEGKGPDTRVGDAMTRDIKYCFDDEDVEHVAQNMSDIQVRRLPVMNREKRLVGIVSLGDLIPGAQLDLIGETLGGISRPGGTHCQSNGQARAA